VSLFLPLALMAEDYNSLKKDAEVTVTSVHKKPLVLGLTLVKEPAVGPNYAKVSDFVSAAGVKGGAVELKKLLKQDKKVVFTLKKDLKVLSDEEIEKAHLN